MSPLLTLTARATHARPLPPAALASVPCGFVLVRVPVRASLHSKPNSNPNSLASESPSPTTTRQEGFQRWRCSPSKDAVPIARQPGGRRVLFSRMMRAVESYQQKPAQTLTATRLACVVELALPGCIAEKKGAVSCYEVDIDQGSAHSPTSKAFRERRASV